MEDSLQSQGENQCNTRILMVLEGVAVIGGATVPASTPTAARTKQGSSPSLLPSLHQRLHQAHAVSKYRGVSLFMPIVYMNEGMVCMYESNNVRD